MYVNASFLFAPSPGLRPDKHFEPRRCDKTPKKPAHANPDPSHGRHELRGHWRVLRAQPRRPRAMHSGQVRRHDRQGNGEGARAAAQRGHSTPEAPHTPAAGHRGKARLARKQNRAPALRGPQHPSTHARFATCRRLRRTVESRENQSTTACPWDAGSGQLISAGGHRPFGLWRRPPAAAAPPQEAPGLLRAAGAGERRGRLTPQREHFARRAACCSLLAESAAAAHRHRQHGLTTNKCTGDRRS
jgi:hypothetical protein